MKSYENLKAKSVSIEKVRDYWKGKNIPQIWYSDIEPGTVPYYNNVRKQRFEFYYPYLKDSAEFQYHKDEKVLTFETGQTNGYGGQYFVIKEIPKSSSEKAERIVWTDAVTLVGDQLGGTPKAKRKKGGQVKLFLPRFARGYYYSLSSKDGEPDGRFEGRTQKMTDILIAAEEFWIPSKECEKYAYYRFRF